MIYADPPWEYGGTQFFNKGTGNTGEAASHYNTMTLSQLRALPVPSIAADNCLLFLWTSSPHLDVAIDLIRHWGFTYATVAFVWDKGAQNTNPGHYTQSQVELCLVAKRGLIPTPRGARDQRQYVLCGRGRHSAKPLEVKQRIGRMFPKQRKIELFAREGFSEDWTHWGVEAKMADNQFNLLTP